MSNRIEAPGRSALWTEAALRALTGTAAQTEFNSGPDAEDGSFDPDAIAAGAKAIADAFEAQCIREHEAEQEARRERVRTIGRFRFIGDPGRLLTVESVEGDDVTFAPFPGDLGKRHSAVEHVLDPSCYTPEPAPTPTGGEERA